MNKVFKLKNKNLKNLGENINKNLGEKMMKNLLFYQSIKMLFPFD